MECQIKSVYITTEEKRYILSLNEEEARWLRVAMQNPLHESTLEEDWEINRKIRTTIVSLLSD